MAERLHGGEAMTTNQTIDRVPRSVLEKALIDAMGSRARHSPHIAQLRALLYAPACKACNDTGKMHEPGQGPGECSACFKEPAAQHQGEPVAVVPELTSELRWILGQMCFQHIHTAQALRLMGHEIARKAEDEQAVTIYWMLGHYLKDPANWRQNASAEMKAAAPKA